jgi:hypothetical protein
MGAATLERVARVLARGTTRRGVLRGLGGLALAAVLGTALPHRAAAVSGCEKRCRRHCRRREHRPIFGCSFKCLLRCW